MSLVKLLPAWFHAVADYAVGILLIVVAAAVGGSTGAVATGIWDVAPRWMQPMIWLLKKLIMITPEKAAKSIVQLALSGEVEGKTGLYFNQLKPKDPSKLALDDELAEAMLGEMRPRPRDPDRVGRREVAQHLRIGRHRSKRRGILIAPFAQ